MIPTLERTALDSVARSCPAIRADPEVAESVVVSIEIVVVFPAPFGPSSANSSPAPTVKEIPATASTSAPLYRFVRPSTTMVGPSSADTSANDAASCGA